MSGPTWIRAVIFRAQPVERRPRSPWLFGSSGLPPAACGLALPGFLAPYNGHPGHQWPMDTMVVGVAISAKAWSHLLGIQLLQEIGCCGRFSAGPACLQY